MVLDLEPPPAPKQKSLTMILSNSNDSDDNFAGATGATNDIEFDKPHSKKIAAANRIRSCLREWNDYVIGDFNKIRAHYIIPNFILCHADDKLCKELEENCGLITISRDLSISTSQMNVENMIIGDTEISDPFSFFKSLSRCHSVVIIEPFLLKQDYAWIKRLIEGIIGKGLKTSPIKVMIITKAGEGNKNHMAKLIEDFSYIAQFEHIERVNLHDRNIFTNSYWVSSDYGFMRKYPKGGTKWTTYPLGLYFQDFYDRLATNLSFLKVHRHRSENHLAKGFCG